MPLIVIALKKISPLALDSLWIIIELVKNTLFNRCYICASFLYKRHQSNVLDIFLWKVEFIYVMEIRYVVT